MPCLQGHQRREVAEAEVPPVGCRVVIWAGISHGHPFIPGLQRHLASPVPASFRSRLVVLGSISPGIIGGFVIVPEGNQWVRGVHDLRLRVSLVLRVPQPVVLERDHLAWRHMLAAQLCTDSPAVAVWPIFVQIVAKVQNEVD